MPTNTSMDHCPDCGATLPPEARFCSQCGVDLGADDTLEHPAETVVPDAAIEQSPGTVIPDETIEHPPETVIPDAATAPPPEPAEFPATLHQMHRRPLGIHPVTVLGGLGGLALLAAIILLAVAALIAGFILLGLAVVLLALFVVGIRREPHSATARGLRRGVDRLRSLASLAAVTVRVWPHAGLHLMRIRQQQRRLRRELQRQMTPLGEAVYHEDHERAHELKLRAKRLDRELNEAQRTASSVIGGARGKIERERATFEPTQSFPRAG